MSFWPISLQAYSAHRNPDAEAMCDLAMYNYVEMRDLVAKRSFLIRKKLDNMLYWLMPNVWIPLYTSVTFSRYRYSQCISNKRWQDELLDKVVYYITCGGCLAGLVTISNENIRSKDKQLTALAFNVANRYC